MKEIKNKVMYKFDKQLEQATEFYAINEKVEKKLKERIELRTKMNINFEKYGTCIQEHICPKCGGELDSFKEDGKVMQLHGTTAPAKPKDYLKCVKCQFIHNNLPENEAK